MTKTQKLFAALLAPTLFAGTANAAVQAAIDTGDNNASSADLLQSSAYSSIVGVGNPNETPDPDGADVLRDGVALTNAGYTDGSAYNQDSIRVRSDQGPTVIDFNFNTLVNVSSIDIFHGHGDTGRDGIVQFTVESSSNGGSTLSTVLDYNGPKLDGSPTYHKTSVFDDGAADIATGVNFIRITFAEIELNGFTSVSEIDINGVVPEPSSLALLGLGGLLIARRRA